MAARSAPSAPAQEHEPPLRVPPVRRRRPRRAPRCRCPPRTPARRTPTSAPAASRTRSASARSPASSRSAVADSPRRGPRTAARPPRPAAARPARRTSRSRPSPASSRGRPAPRPSAAAQVVSPRAQTNSSERGAHGAPRPRRRARPPSRRPRRAREIRTSTASCARVGRDDRVGRPEQRLAEPLRDQRLADAREAQRPDDALEAHAPRGEPRQDLGRPTSAASRAAGPGSVTIDAAVGPVDPPAGRGAVGVRRASSADGISHACLRLASGNGWRRRAHRPAQPLERRVDPRPASRRRPPRPPRGSGRPASDRGRPW